MRITIVRSPDGIPSIEVVPETTQEKFILDNLWFATHTDEEGRIEREKETT